MCEPEAPVGLSAGVRALGVFAGIAVGAGLLAAARSFTAAVVPLAASVVAVEGAAAAAMIVVLVRVLAPRKARVQVQPELQARAALPAPPLALEAPKLRPVTGAGRENEVTRWEAH
jgi:hypothetical protein